MQRKSRGWLRKMRELGLGRHGFGGWMSGTEMIIQRGLGLEEIQEKRSGLRILDQERLGQVRLGQMRLDQVKTLGQVKTLDQVKTLGQRKRSGQGNNVYQMLRKHSSVLPPSPFTNLDNDLWELRRQLIIQIAKRRNGKVRLQEVAAECNVNIRIAAEWLKCLSQEGMLSLVAGQQNVIVYSMKEVRRT